MKTSLLALCSLLLAPCLFADTQISGLPAKPSPSPADYLAIIDAAAHTANPNNQNARKITMQQLQSSIGGGTPAWSAITGIPTTRAGYGLTDVNYIGTYFNSADEKLQVIGSRDAVTWTSIAADAYTAPSGDVVRDPSIAKIGDTWWVVYTADDFGVERNYFGLAKSRDLINWTWVQNIVTNVSATQNWAPEWFIDKDGSAHVIVGVSTDNTVTFAEVEVHPTTADPGGAWSTATGLTITGLYGPNAYDGQIILSGGTYYLFFVDNNAVEMATSSTLGGTYTVVGFLKFNGVTNSSKEGPTVFPLENGKWGIIINPLSTNNEYLASTSTLSDPTSWSALTQVMSTYEHGTVKKLRSDTLANLDYLDDGAILKKAGSRLVPAIPGVDYASNGLIIAKTVLASPARNITVNVPAGAPTHMMRGYFISREGGATAAQLELYFNGDVGSNYVVENGYAFGSTAAAQYLSPRGTIILGDSTTTSDQTAGKADVVTFEVPDYAGSTFFKSGVSRKSSFGATDILQSNGFMWQSTAPITSVLVGTNQAGNNLVAGSELVLIFE